MASVRAAQVSHLVGVGNAGRSESWAIHYRHIRGVTAGMDVVWQLEPSAADTEVSIVHEWSGPPWPIVGTTAADRVIGPVFIHGIASRTLSGIARYVEEAAVSAVSAVEAVWRWRSREAANESICD